MKIKHLLCFALVLGWAFAVRNCEAGIIYPQEPAGARETAYTNAFLIQQNYRRCLGGVPVEQLTMTGPFRSYYVSPRDLVSGRLLAAARATDWTYVFLHGTNDVGSEDLVPAGKSGALEFAGLYETDFSIEALRTAERLPQVKKQNYEVRRLVCPPIQFRGIWLHGKTDDIIIPLPETFGRWLAYFPYSEFEMLHLLKPAAELEILEPSGPGLGD